MSTQMDELLAQLASARQDSENFGNIWKGITNAAIEAANATPEWIEANQGFVDACQREFNLTTQIKELALANYARDSNKHPHENIEIKVFSVVKLAKDKIGDLKEWCFTNFRPALKLDETKCIDAAKKGDIPAEFYESYSEPRVQIATKL